ncbi:MAG: hypothetical protein ACJ0FO_00840 [Gammaproteobacteria bacterium]|jgi:hypothetical protein|tara:strand:- start:3593 stop:4042 length:450 start_codon:yes stop_codon:yes gene_type:complete
MIAFVMLSNKSQYILSKIGIPLFEDAKNPTKNDEINIYFFQKDNILTLHANSVDEYSEKEIKLLEAIIEAIHGPNQSASQGVVTSSSREPFNTKDFKVSSDLKATLVFCELNNLFDGLDFIVSPTLEDMLANPDLKKDLWSKLKPLQST